MKNETTQDCVALASILEAILGRMRIERPLAKEVSLLSDNTSCYQNNLLPVIDPFIAKGHGMNLKEIVHSETQRGKSLLDAHFTLAMRDVNKFVNDTTLNASTPCDLVTAMKHRDGVANTTVELTDIDRNNSCLIKWTAAQKERRMAVIAASMKYHTCKHRPEHTEPSHMNIPGDTVCPGILPGSSLRKW